MNTIYETKAQNGRAVLTTIRDHAVLGTLSTSHLEIITHGAEEVRFGPGEIICREGQPANRFYLVHEGEVALEAHDYQRGNTLVQQLGKGELLGWSWLFEPFVWHFQARALTETTLLTLDGAHLLVSCEKNHTFGFELMRRVSEVVVHRLEAACRQLAHTQKGARIPPDQSRKPHAEQPVTVEAAVSKHPFFNGLSAAHLRVLIDQAMAVHFQTGQLVLEAGAPANRFYAIEHGRVEVESDSLDGSVPIQSVGDGEILGWSWLYMPYHCHFSARALQPTSAVFFYGTRLRQACESDHEFGYQMIKRTTQVVINRLQATRRQLLECVTTG